MFTTGGWPRSVSSRATSQLIAFTAVTNPNVDPGPTFSRRPGMSIIASPAGTQVSTTISAISQSRLPLECRAETDCVCSMEVSATRVRSCFLTSRAMSMTTPLIPDWEKIIIVSRGSSR